MQGIYAAGQVSHFNTPLVFTANDMRLPAAWNVTIDRLAG